MSGFAAQYPGRCPDCDEVIRVGDQVRYADDWVVHVDCEESAPRERPVNETCTECWIIKPCGCGEQ